MLICYVHGFLSGPNAVKAHALHDYLATHEPKIEFQALDFPDTPREALTELQAQLSSWYQSHPQGKLCLVGSSFGGFLSTLLCAQFSCKAVLLNPCSHPQEYFANLCTSYTNPLTQRQFTLTLDMLPYLESLDRSIVVRPEMTQVYLGGQDEVLDYRKSLLLYNQCDIRFYKDEDHAFTHNFAALLPHIIAFAKAC